MKPTIRTLLLALASVVTFPTFGLASPPLVEVAINAGGWGSSGWVGTATAPSGYLSRSSAHSRASSGYSGNGDSSVAATFGVLRTKSKLQLSSGPNTTGLFYTWGRARFRDERTTDAPGRAGQSALVTVKFTITGTVTLNAPPANGANSESYSQADYEIRVNGNGVAGKTQKLSADGNPFCGDAGCSNFLGVEQTVTYQVTLGAPYDFDVTINSRPTLYVPFANFQGQAAADLGNTLVWGGIVSVTTPDGTPINDYTDTSLSGADYKAPIAPVCATPSDALAGWWPGDNNARDIEGGNHGVLENGASYATGLVGQAFSFPSAGARVHVPHSAALNFNPTQDYTIDFWMKAGPQSGAATLVEKNGGTFPYSVRLLPTGNIQASAYDGTSTVSVTGTTGSGANALGVVHDNLWHHIAVVFKHSSKVLELYVDGALNASQTYTETLGTLANGQDLYFGARGDGSNSYNGLLDEVDIASGAFSVSEIQAIVLANFLGKCRPPVIATGAVSRKTHGGEGDFDVVLPLTGTTGVECRSGGATRDYEVIVNFDSPVTLEGTPQAEIVAGSANIGSAGTSNGGVVAVNGSSITIPLTNVANEQTLSIKLNAVSNGASVADLFIPMSVLVGDTNADRAVNAGDALQTRNRSGQAATANTFRSDVNGDGTINSGDATAVKSRSGTALP